MGDVLFVAPEKLFPIVVFRHGNNQYQHDSNRNLSKDDSIFFQRQSIWDNDRQYDTQRKQYISNGEGKPKSQMDI